LACRNRPRGQGEVTKELSAGKNISEQRKEMSDNKGRKIKQRLPSPLYGAPEIISVVES
jgi:hypothetical protein